MSGPKHVQQLRGLQQFGDSLDLGDADAFRNAATTAAAPASEAVCDCTIARERSERPARSAITRLPARARDADGARKRGAIGDRLDMQARSR